MPKNITKPRLLVGEGKHEEEFFGALLKKLGMQDDVAVDEYGGKYRLPAFIKLLSVAPLIVRGEMQAVGIVRDADWTEIDDEGVRTVTPVSPARAFQSVAGALAAAGLPVPSGPGAIAPAVARGPRVGVYIMPNNREPGSLEDLCLQAVSDCPEMVCLDEYFGCVEAKAGRVPGHRAKARVQAWLATQHEPDVHLGTGAKKDYWPLDAPAFEEFRGFLTELFGA